MKHLKQPIFWNVILLGSVWLYPDDSTLNFIRIYLAGMYTAAGLVNWSNERWATK